MSPAAAGGQRRGANGGLSGARRRLGAACGVGGGHRARIPHLRPYPPRFWSLKWPETQPESRLRHPKTAWKRLETPPKPRKTTAPKQGA